MLGKVENLSDGAGLTRFGITQRDDSAKVATDFFTSTDLPTVIQNARHFYTDNFWIKFSLYKDPLPIAASYLSALVNCGLQAEMWMFNARHLAPSYALDWFISRWIEHYRWLVRVKPSDNKFFNGWYSRAMAVYPALPK